MPIIQVLLIGVIGAYLASGFSNVLTTSARRDMNKVVFTVFTPSLMFASLAKTVTLADVISWWFMPVNIAITFMIGGTLGWIACNILKPPQHFRGLIMAFCSAGNLGNLLLIIVPAVCDEDGNPFGDDSSTCRSRSLSYSSLSMGGSYFSRPPSCPRAVWRYKAQNIRRMSYCCILKSDLRLTGGCQRLLTTHDGGTSVIECTLSFSSVATAV